MRFTATKIIILFFATALAAFLILVDLAGEETGSGELKTAGQTELEAPPAAEESQVRETHKAVRIIDGDTVELENGERLRLIGIDAPESGQRYFSEARGRLAEFVLNKEVALEKDVSDKDEYGRLLRHVWFGDTFVNLEMVRLGYARALTIPPDLKYKDLFLDAERQARQNQLGQW